MAVALRTTRPGTSCLGPASRSMADAEWPWRSGRLVPGRVAWALPPRSVGAEWPVGSGRLVPGRVTDHGLALSGRGAPYDSSWDELLATAPLCKNNTEWP